MAIVSLLGAAAFLCVLFGIPFGIWFGKSQHACNAALPVLDFMQTMPAFVYLIPIIAFFGTGKPPGVLATLVFGMPPIIRLFVQYPGQSTLLTPSRRCGSMVMVKFGVVDKWRR